MYTWLMTFFPFKILLPYTKEARPPLVDFQTAYKMTSQSIILAWTMDKKNPNLYYFM